MFSHGDLLEIGFQSVIQFGIEVYASRLIVAEVTEVHHIAHLVGFLAERAVENVPSGDVLNSPTCRR